MYQDIRAFCESCWFCRKQQLPAPAMKVLMVIKAVSGPLERLKTDITEMPDSAEENKYAMVIMDFFIKYSRFTPYQTKNGDHA